MWTDLQHLEDLSNHILKVRANCFKIAKHFIDTDPELARSLVAQGFRHDNSKFSGIEAMYLHRGPNVDPSQLSFAISKHVQLNYHHPESWESEGIIHMSRKYAFEMVCDLLARSQEFGTDFKSYLNEVHFKKYKFDQDTLIHIQTAVGILLPEKFSPYIPTLAQLRGIPPRPK